MLFEIWDSLEPAGRRAEWQKFVQTHEWASPYLDSTWIEHLSASFGWKSCHAVMRENGALQGLLPAFICGLPLHRRVVSLPFCHYAPMLTDDVSLVPDMLRTLKEYALDKRVDSVMLRALLADKNTLEQLAEVSVSPLQGWHSQPDKWVSVLDLRQYGGRAVPHAGAVARNIRKAVGLGVFVKEETSPETCRALYDMLLVTRKRQGVPPYPRFFIENLYHCKGVRIFQAHWQNKPVATVALLGTQRRAIYMYGASLPEAYAVRANDLLFAKIIDVLSVEAAFELDFGSTPMWHTELLRFKNKWGCLSTAMSSLVWSVNGCPEKRQDPRTTLLGRWAGACIRRMPNALLAKTADYLFAFLA